MRIVEQTRDRLRIVDRKVNAFTRSGIVAGLFFTVPMAIGVIASPTPDHITGAIVFLGFIWIILGIGWIAMGGLSASPTLEVDGASRTIRIGKSEFSFDEIAGVTEDQYAGLEFSQIKHGLLLGKYDELVQYPEGDFRSRIPVFRDKAFIDRMKRAADAMRKRFPKEGEPVLHAVIGALLAGNPTSCVLLGQRNAKQAAAAAAVGESLSAADAGWVKRVYRGETV